MSAFSFPEPPVENGTEVTNSTTGVTYRYDAVHDTWQIVTTDLATDIDSHLSDLSGELARLNGVVDAALIEKDEILENAIINNSNQDNRIDNLEEALVTYQIGTDKVMRSTDPAIELVDSNGFYSNVKFKGTGGLSVSSDLQSIIIDGSNIDPGDSDVQLSINWSTNRIDIKVNDDLASGCSLPLGTDTLAGLMGPDDRRHIYTWNDADYYSKDEIDSQFTLRGVGYKYLFSSFGGQPTIREGEFTTDNRIVGQVTFISIAPTDDDGKNRRDAVSGDTIELYDAVTTKYYRFIISSGSDGMYGVTYVGPDVDKDDAMGIGSPFLIYLYPTHISSANYYDKAASDTRFMSLLQGQKQTCNRITQFTQALEYTGTVAYSNNVTNKSYVDNKVASAVLTLATKDYVNSEVSQAVGSLSLPTTKKEIYYGDYAPTDELENGDLWFDSMHLRLNVYSQGAWINPDRNDGKDLENRITVLEARIVQLEGN